MLNPLHTADVVLEDGTKKLKTSNLVTVEMLKGFDPVDGKIKTVTMGKMPESYIHTRNIKKNTIMTLKAGQQFRFDTDMGFHCFSYNVDTKVLVKDIYMVNPHTYIIEATTITDRFPLRFNLGETSHNIKDLIDGGEAAEILYA